MPPQPVRRVLPEIGYEFSPELMFRRPEVATWIAQCIGCWSWVETQRGRLLAYLVGINVQDGIELYNNFRSASSKDASFKILARARLQTDDFKIFDALLQVIATHEKTRNKLAHWFWGYSSDIEDGLILMDPREILRHQAAMQDFNNKHGPSGRVPMELIKYNLDHIYVWRVDDLKRDAESFTSLAGLIVRCGGLIGLKGEELTRRRDELSKDARIAERLNPASL